MLCVNTTQWSYNKTFSAVLEAQWSISRLGYFYENQVKFLRRSCKVGSPK